MKQSGKMGGPTKLAFKAFLTLFLAIRPTGEASEPDQCEVL